MNIKQIVIAAILGATLGVVASSVHAEAAGENMQLRGKFTCDAMVWPVGAYPFSGQAESQQVRRYSVEANSLMLEFQALAGGGTINVFSSGTRDGVYGKNGEYAMSGRWKSDGQVYFMYYNEMSGDSVGFFNCVAKRKF